jgi:hypothetical protein
MFGSLDPSSGAAINKRPSDGTRESFSYSSYAITDRFALAVASDHGVRTADSVIYHGRERSLGILATECISTVPACTRLSFNVENGKGGLAPTL